MKTCFVIMGFGVKTAFPEGRKVDLDLIYKRVIKPVFSENFSKEYQIVRADELTDSGLIDIPMYKLLMSADLVIADITTLNANAIYELGVRHTVKPYATLIIGQKTNTGIPFDINHVRVFTYEPYGEVLDPDEESRIKKELKKRVDDITKKLNNPNEESIDSPLYSLFGSDIEFKIKKEEIKAIKKVEDGISNNIKRYKQCLFESNYQGAVRYLQQIIKVNGNPYFVQQLAVATYKSEKPNKTIALQDAKSIIDRLKPKETLDLETIGIAASIYKRLYFLGENTDYLDEAIFLYRKGYYSSNDYYNGENYANCLLLKSKHLIGEDADFLKKQSIEIYQEIRDILNLTEIEEGAYWKYATLAISSFVCNKEIEGKKWEDKFLITSSTEWEHKTYLENKAMVLGILKGENYGA